EREAVGVFVEAVLLREPHLQRREGRSRVLRWDRHRDPVDVPRRIILDEGRILALRDRLEKSIQGIRAVLCRGAVRDISDFHAKIRDQLMALLEWERDLPLLRFVARVVELLDVRYPLEALF